MMAEINQTAREFSFDDLQTGDILQLETQNSTYRFMLTETLLRKGVLTGGAFGKQLVKADVCEPCELRAGRQVQFHVEMPDHHIYLKTTMLTGVKIVRRRPARLERLNTLANYPRPVQF